MFVFSDDIAWAKANLPQTRPMTFVGEEAPRSGLADLWLMTLARHHIIANSSFSWWGAWLAQRQDGETIAPARWFADGSYDEKDLLPTNWTRLPAERDRICGREVRRPATNGAEGARRASSRSGVSRARSA